MKIKVVERVGETMKDLLQRSDPFSKNSCDRLDCLIYGKKLKISSNSGYTKGRLEELFTAGLESTRRISR